MSENLIKKFSLFPSGDKLDNEELDKVRYSLLEECLQRDHGDLFEGGYTFAETVHIINDYTEKFNKEFNQMLKNVGERLIDEIEEDGLKHFNQIDPKKKLNVESVITFNKKHGRLSKKSYSLRKGVEFILEELLEMLGYEDGRESSKQIFRNLSKDIEYDKITSEEASELLDGYGDIIVFAIGEMAKIIEFYKSDKDSDRLYYPVIDSSGYKADDEEYSHMLLSSMISDIFNIIMRYNMKKPHKLDADGKVIKTKDYLNDLTIKRPQDAIRIILESNFNVLKETEEEENNNEGK